MYDKISSSSIFSVQQFIYYFTRLVIRLGECEMLEALNRRLEKFMPFITPLSVGIGVLFTEQLVGYSSFIPFIFAFMTFSGSLSSSFRSLTSSLKHPFPIVVVLLLLHVLMPLIAWSVGQVVFQDQLTITGLVLASVIPTGITSFIWVTIYKGNMGLALSIILIDTILSPLLVPYALACLVGEKVEMNILSMMMGLLYMVVIPSLFGMIIHSITKGKSRIASKKLAPFSKVALASVVMINGAVVAPFLKSEGETLLKIIITVFLLAALGYILAWLLGHIFKRDRDTKLVMMFTGGMRNISAGAVIAVQYFPAPVAVPVVVGMLFQQVLASLFGFLFKKLEDEKDQLKGKLLKTDN